jgi:hypothetical protein
MRVVAASLLVIGALAAPLAACGREAPHQVRLSVEQISSIAAEGALMADDVARARSKTTFVRVHGEDLSSQAQHEAEKLNDDPISPDLHGRVKAAIKLAGDIGSAIDDLRTSPQDRTQARMDASKLRSWSDQARKLAESI